MCDGRMIIFLSSFTLCPLVKEVLETLVISLKDVLSRPPSEALLVEQYSVLCLTLDEIIVEVHPRIDNDGSDLMAVCIGDLS